jgi:hypothetical protein
MKLHNVTEFYTEWFRVLFNITLVFLTIAIFKSFVKRNTVSNETCGHFRDLLVYQP